MNKFLLVCILLVPFASSLIGFLIGRKNESLRDKFNIAVTGLEFLMVVFLYFRGIDAPIEISLPHVMGTGLHLKLDSFRFVFVVITSFVWFLITIYSTQYLIRYKNRNRYYAFFMLTLGSTIGVFVSENLLNLFTFFEIMAFTSYTLVIHDEDKYAHEAGRSYLVMSIGGGLVTLMGLILLYDYVPVLDISEIGEKLRSAGDVKYLISLLILVGFFVKASVFPFHTWLPKAHPAAPTPASAVLSGILIKTGIFGIIIVARDIMEYDFKLSVLLIVLGLINMLFGGFMALFQRNIKRILAYSSMSQAGYIVLAIGLAGILKKYGYVGEMGFMSHIANHAIFKVLLFMGAGIIYMIVHDLSINAIRGFGAYKPLLKGVFAVAFLAIIGTPLFNGYVSKTIIHKAMAKAHHIYHGPYMTIGEIIFVISSSFTVAYLLKIFVAVFVEKNEEKYYGQHIDEVRKRALFTMFVMASIVIAVGMRPEFLMKLIGASEDHYSKIHFYSIENIKSYLVTLGLGVSIYFFLVRKFLLSDDKKTYTNPTLNFISLEDHVYLPLGKVVFKAGRIIFTGIEVVVLGITKNATRIFGILKDISHIGDVKMENPMKRLENLEFKMNRPKIELDDMKLPSNVIVQVKNIGFSISLFAFVLVTVLLVTLLR